MRMSEEETDKWNTGRHEVKLQRLIRGYKQKLPFLPAYDNGGEA